MADVAFIRLSEIVNKKQNKRVVSVKVVPTIIDCSGTIWFTDLQLRGPRSDGLCSSHGNLSEGKVY